MKDLKMKYKHIIFISLMVSLFNFFIDPQSIFGLISLFMFFVFIMAWINYIIYTLTKKDIKTAEKIIAEVYLTLILVSCFIVFLSIIVPFSLGTLFSNILYFILSPMIGIRFLVRPILLWIIVSSILSFLLVLVIRKMTK